MSSWGSGSKFSNLQQVGDFSILGSKSVIFLQRILERILNLMSSHRFFGFSVNSAVKFIFWGGGKHKILVLVDGFNLIFFLVNSAVKVHFLFDGTDGTGWTGWTEYQKCPLNFFILCVYIDKVYTYLYTK